MRVSGWRSFDSDRTSSVNVCAIYDHNGLPCLEWNFQLDDVIPFLDRDGFFSLFCPFVHVTTSAND